MNNTGVALRTVKFTTDSEIVEHLDRYRTRHLTRTRLLELAVVQFLRRLAAKDARLGGHPHDGV